MAKKRQAVASVPERRVVFALSHGQAAREDWAVFRRLAELAAARGGTHVLVGQIPFRYGNWVLRDNHDPYAAWSNTGTALFRVCPPPALREWVDEAHAEACRAHLARQLDILRPYGLRGIAHAVEPHWLPEGVFRAHPRWRGAQCELGRIALRPYFAPSLDEPEVLELYRLAVDDFCHRFPEVDLFEFLSNDSGGGIAWTPCIYPGMNGPPRHRLRDGGERIAAWLNTLRRAAVAAGADTRFNIYSSGFPQELRASVRAKLDPGVFLSAANAHGETLWSGGATLGGGLWHPAYPVVGIPDPEGFLQGLESVCGPAAATRGFCQINLHESLFDLAEEMLRAGRAEPAQGSVSRARQLAAAAGWFTGSPAHADAVVDAWRQIRQALHAAQQIRQKGFGLVFNFCSVSMRWLLRPLVPDPARLTDADTAYYRQFLFAAGAEAKKDPRFGMVLGKAVFNGEAVTWMSRWCLQEAADTLRGVRGRLEKLAGELPGDGAARVRLLAARAGALACLAMNARNCIMYQYALDTAAQPLYGPNQIDYDDNILYDQRALSLRKIAREELDNTVELLELVEAHGRDVIEFARTPDEESVFRFGPDLVGDLRRKLDLMLDHWQDYETLYPATKVWDPEPEPRGNLPPMPPRPG